MCSNLLIVFVFVFVKLCPFFCVKCLLSSIFLSVFVLVSTSMCFGVCVCVYVRESVRVCVCLCSGLHFCVWPIILVLTKWPWCNVLPQQWKAMILFHTQFLRNHRFYFADSLVWSVDTPTPLPSPHRLVSSLVAMVTVDFFSVCANRGCLGGFFCVVLRRAAPLPWW